MWEESNFEVNVLILISTISDKIRVGDEYQANVPEVMARPEKNHDYAHLNLEQSMLLWSPPKDVAESKVEEFINIANGRHGYNDEQALGERKLASLIAFNINFVGIRNADISQIQFREGHHWFG